jgi:hypothetical protein
MSEFGITHWLIVAGIVWILWNILRRRPAKTNGRVSKSTGPDGGFPRIRGNGRYEVEVVGESHYDSSFEALRRRHKPADAEDESFGDALLTLESSNPHDPNAVAVHIEGLPVGYLSRAMARDFRQAIVRDGLQKYSQFAVGARLYWGGEDRLHSVQLDLPQA